MSATDEEIDHDAPEFPDVACIWCNGRGSFAVEPNSSTRYRCEDCDGSGRSVKKAA